MRTTNARYKPLNTQGAAELICKFDLENVRAAIVRKDDPKDERTYYYLNSYRSLLKLAKQTTDDDKNDGLRALSLAAYGWMPTIPKQDAFERFGHAPVKTIKAIKTCGPALAFIDNIGKNNIDKKAPINNSWIGTSKVMHFLNPEAFPIWDSKIAAKFDLSASRHNNMGRYIEYTQFMHDQVAEVGNSFEEMASLIDVNYGYMPSVIRCLEFYLFTVLG